MSKYNVGDVVKLRDDLEEGENYGSSDYLEKMGIMKNKPITILTIPKLFKDCYEVVDETGENWFLSDEMIEGLWEECKEKQVTMKYKIGDRFRYKDEYNTYRIISCDEEAGKYITVEEKQVGSRAFDVCEEKNMFLEECNNEKNVTATIFENMNNNDNFPKQTLKLIDVLNMIAKGELKEGTKFVYRGNMYIWEDNAILNTTNLDAFDIADRSDLNMQLKLIEPPCEHEWENYETHRIGEGLINKGRRCKKCGLEEVTEERNVEADKTIEPTKIEELEFNKLLTIEGNVILIINKLNEVIKKVNAQTTVLLTQNDKDYEEAVKVLKNN